MTDPKLQEGFARDVVFAQAGRHEPRRGAWRRTANQRPAQACRQGRRIHTGHACHRRRDHGRGRDGAGKVNKDIVNLINRYGGKAVGLTGQDGAFIRAHKMMLESSDEPGKMLDIGLVGEISSIDPSIISFSRFR